MNGDVRKEFSDLSDPRDHVESDHPIDDHQDHRRVDPKRESDHYDHIEGEHPGDDPRGHPGDDHRNHTKGDHRESDHREGDHSQRQYRKEDHRQGDPSQELKEDGGDHRTPHIIRDRGYDYPSPLRADVLSPPVGFSEIAAPAADLNTENPMVLSDWITASTQELNELRAYVERNKQYVPGPPPQGDDGSQWKTLRDPIGERPLERESLLRTECLYYKQQAQKVAYENQELQTSNDLLRGRLQRMKEEREAIQIELADM